MAGSADSCSFLPAATKSLCNDTTISALLVLRTLRSRVIKARRTAVADQRLVDSFHYRCSNNPPCRLYSIMEIIGRCLLVTRSGLCSPLPICAACLGWDWAARRRENCLRSCRFGCPHGVHSKTFREALDEGARGFKRRSDRQFGLAICLDWDGRIGDVELGLTGSSAGIANR